MANPLLDPSNLRHGAFPFNLLKNEHFEPALTTAMNDARVTLDKIRADKSPATFENTILALETAGEGVGRVTTVLYNLAHANTSEELQALVQKTGPQLATYASDISLDPRIFARVKAVWDRRAELGLKDEEFRLTEKTFKDFARNGALLDDAKKEQLRQLDQELSTVSPKFSDNVLKATNAFEMWVTDAADLVGLPKSAVEAASEAAKEKGRPQEWLFTLQIPSYLPFMTYSERRPLREKMYRAYSSRAFRDDYSNEALTKQIAVLRHKRAELLGQNSHADFVLQERMAESPEKAKAFLDQLLVKAKPAAERELQQLKDFAKQESGETDFQAWDTAFWSERLKRKLHDLDEEVVRQYFKLENVIDGVFEHARRLYGLKFTEVKDLPVYHPDVRVFEVGESTPEGKFIGLFYTDFFPRPSKQGGAWASSFREQGLQGGKVERPHSQIVCNFPKSTATTPSLLTLNDVRTLFHEFGHALHTLLSDVKYTTLAGTNVYWDFVELPSQIMENWALEEEGLALFAKHYKTGETMPKALIEKIRASSRFQAGWMTMRQLTFAFLDLAWHSADPAQIADVQEFERQVTARSTLLPPPSTSNISTSFAHIFAGGYSAGYYSYKWAEVLDADAFELFKEKGLFNEEIAFKFRDNILSRGGTKHPMELYKAFRGREPDPDALLRRDGLI